MRPITRKLRVLAAALGLAQGAIPAQALAHELAGGDFRAISAHVESEGARHDAAGHPHDCGLCSHVVFKVGFAAVADAFLGNGAERGGQACDTRNTAFCCDDGSAPLPRGPPVG